MEQHEAHEVILLRELIEQVSGRPWSATRTSADYGKEIRLSLPMAMRLLEQIEYLQAVSLR